MRWLVLSAIIFFATLMAAGLVALGAPATLDVVGSAASVHRHATAPPAPMTSLQRRADIRWAVQMAAAQGQR
jgi:hypothetical protein